MTTHGRTGPGRWVFGSVADSIVAASPVPVLVRARGSRCLVTPCSTPIETSSCRWMDQHSRHQSLTPRQRLRDLRADLVLLMAEDDPFSIRRADEYLSGVGNRLTSKFPELTITCEVRNGEAAHAIETAFALLPASLVFMATHGALVRAEPCSAASRATWFRRATYRWCYSDPRPCKPTKSSMQREGTRRTDRPTNADGPHRLPRLTQVHHFSGKEYTNPSLARVVLTWRCRRESGVVHPAVAQQARPSAESRDRPRGHAWGRSTGNGVPN